MTIEEIKDKVNSPQYDFLRTNPHLGDRIILLGLSGSHAYGMNVETSDVDIRGCALNTKEELLTNQNFEQFENKATDTVIYGFNKLISLLSNCNPNCIEILGLKPEHYLYLSPIGQELIDHAELFLSKRAIHTFGGYANSQLRRLNNISNRYVSQPEQEQYILNSINNASYNFKQLYYPMDEDGRVDLYIDQSTVPDQETEIFMDINLKHYPLRDWCGMWNEMKSIASSYTRLGKRNSHAKEHGRIAKHMAHLVRLYLMCFDILRYKKIVTYRSADHDLLMDIRNGEYIDENEQPIPEFYELVDILENRLDQYKKETDLPEKPNYKRINEFVVSINEKVVKGEI